MTVSSNSESITVTYEDSKGKQQELTLPLESATDLITQLLQQRKAGYEARRTAKAETRNAAKAERDAKKAEREAKAAERKAETLRKLQERIAKLQAQAESKAA